MTCTCHACIKEHDLKGPSGIFLLSAERMILCEVCGDKRCPHADDHRTPCLAAEYKARSWQFSLHITGTDVTRDEIMRQLREAIWHVECGDRGWIGGGSRFFVKMTCEDGNPC